LALPRHWKDSVIRLASFLWSFYCNSLREAEIKVSRAVLLRKLRKAAERAEELEKLAEELWASEDAIVIRELGEFVRVGLDSQSSRPHHRSGVPFVGVLSAFARKTRWLAQALPSDPGGPRYGLTGEEPLVTTQRRFFHFICAVMDALRTMKKRLPAARFRLPKSDRALSMRLQRLAKTSST
jgi:hypothetical protein